MVSQFTGQNSNPPGEMGTCDDYKWLVSAQNLEQVEVWWWVECRLSPA